MRGKEARRKVSLCSQVMEPARCRVPEVDIAGSLAEAMGMVNVRKEKIRLEQSKRYSHLQSSEGARGALGSR